MRQRRERALYGECNAAGVGCACERRIGSSGLVQLVNWNLVEFVGLSTSSVTTRLLLYYIHPNSTKGEPSII